MNAFKINKVSITKHELYLVILTLFFVIQGYLLVAQAIDCVTGTMIVFILFWTVLHRLFVI